jgi:hypothetical protein
MTIIIYTYPPDYLMAATSARMLATDQGLNVVLAIDKNDPPLACEFATVVRTGFDRKGNLNGKEFILGHLKLMAEHATGEYSGKLDSDTALLDARRLLRGRSESAVGLWVDGMDGMNGCCYFLKTADLPAMIREAEKLSELEYHMEDRSTGRVAMAVGEPFFYRWSEPGNLYDRFGSGSSNGWFREHKAVVCFEARDESDRRQVARDMKRLYHQP